MGISAKLDLDNMPEAGSTGNAATLGLEKDAEFSPLLEALELFCSSGDFTETLSAFIRDNAGAFDEEVCAEDEQPLDYHDRYMAYVAQVDILLEKFMSKQGIAPDDVVSACKWASSNNNPVTCVDFLLATTEYVKFLELMCDFKQMQQWESGDALEETLLSSEILALDESEESRCNLD